MNTRQMTRRTVIGLALAALAGLTSFGGAPVFAQNNNGGGLDGWGSKADFEWFCGLVGGGWIDSPGDNMTICVYPDGSREVCDQQGNNCTIYARHAPGGGKRSEINPRITSGATLSADTATPTPRRFAAANTSAAFSVVADDDQP